VGGGEVRKTKDIKNMYTFLFIFMKKDYLSTHFCVEVGLDIVVGFNRFLQSR